MRPWFVWKNQNTESLGLWIAKLPKITRAPERYDTVEIPGKAGTLIMREGDDVFESYLKECTVQTLRNNPKLQEIMDWLSGDGEVTFSNEMNKVYKASILSDVSFDKVSNDIIQAKIPFFVEPFKKKVHREQDRITVTETGTIANPGNVASLPMIRVQKTGAAIIAIGDRSMSFEHLPGDVTIDCEAQIITTKAKAYDSTAYYYIGDYANSNGYRYRFTSEGIGSGTTWEQDGAASDDFVYAWPGKWTGEMLQIPKGTSAVTLTGSPTLTIDPEWRWK